MGFILFCVYKHSFIYVSGHDGQVIIWDMLACVQLRKFFIEVCGMHFECINITTNTFYHSMKTKG